VPGQPLIGQGIDELVRSTQANPFQGLDLIPILGSEIRQPFLEGRNKEPLSQATGKKNGAVRCRLCSSNRRLEARNLGAQPFTTMYARMFRNIIGDAFWPLDWWFTLRIASPNEHYSPPEGIDINPLLTPC